MKKSLLSALFALFFAAHAAAAGEAPGEVTPLIYENARCGLRLNAPPGWVMYRGMRRHPEILAVFSRLPYEEAGAENPRIVLLREKARRRGPDSALAKAYRDAEVLALMKNLPGTVSVELLDGPRQEAETAPLFSTLTFEITQRLKNKRVTSRSREYIFFRDGAFYVLLCAAAPDIFDKYRADFDAAAKSMAWDAR